MSFYSEGDEICARFRPAEVDAIRAVVTEVSTLLAEAARTDPAVARIFPDMYRDDPAAAEELRTYTEEDLRENKLGAAEVVLDTVAEQTHLTPEQADAWLRALNDVRLALGVRLGIHDDFDIEEEYSTAAGERAVRISVYSYLSYLQESLIDALP